LDPNSGKRPLGARFGAPLSLLPTPFVFGTPPHEPANVAAFRACRAGPRARKRRVVRRRRFRGAAWPQAPLRRARGSAASLVALRGPRRRARSGAREARQPGRRSRPRACDGRDGGRRTAARSDRAPGALRSTPGVPAPSAPSREACTAAH
jgi:hypothetical protein